MDANFRAECYFLMDVYNFRKCLTVLVKNATVISTADGHFKAQSCNIFTAMIDEIGQLLNRL